MNRKVALITFVVFVLFIGAGAAAVLALGTSTGMVLGGTTSVSGAAAADAPFQTQAGWIRNNSPWPVTIDSIDVNDSGAAQSPTIYLSETDESDVVPAEGQPPAWTAEPATFPYKMAGGSIRFLGFSVVPAAGKIAAFDDITVNFTGPLPVGFTTQGDTVAVGVSAPDLPVELLAPDPKDSTVSIDAFVGVLRAALASGDLAQLQRAMGDGTTEAEATALRDSQAGFVAQMPVLSKTVTADSRSWTVQFYTTDVAVDGLPALSLKWKDFRWNVALAS